jgi:uncharacterized membrane protein
VVILLVVIPALIIAAVIIALVWRRRSVAPLPDARSARFRWRYIAFPVIIFLLTGVMIALFYSRLPDRVAYHFLVNGTPDRWSSPVPVAIVGLAIQAALVLVGWVIVRVASRMAAFSQTENTVLKPESLLVWMGNLVALPQIIFGFVMMDIFSYNVYQIHLLPVWLFMVIVLVIATIGFIGFLVYMAQKAMRQANK